MGLYTKAVVEHQRFQSLNQDDGEWQIKDIGKIFTVPKSYQPHNGEFTEFPFSYQNYAISAFIADLRNRYGLTPLMEYRPLPDNHELLSSQDPFGKSDHFYDYPSEFLYESSKRWTLVSELLSFDYDTTFRDLSNNDQITTYQTYFEKESLTVARFCYFPLKSAPPHSVSMVNSSELTSCQRKT